MHYTTGQGTRGVLLADYLKAIMLGPTRRRRRARACHPISSRNRASSNLFTQYCPTSPLWVCRPQDMSGSDLTYAFEQGRDLAEKLPGRESLRHTRSALPTRMRCARDR